MDFIDDFIQEYKNNPCLWKANSIHFKNRVKRQEAYMKLINVASKHGEHYNVERTKQKINNLRCAFRHQLKKYFELKNKGEKEEPYCPKRRYFESLMFLKDEECTEVKRRRRQKSGGNNGNNTKLSESESEIASDHNDSTTNTATTIPNATKNRGAKERKHETRGKKVLVLSVEKIANGAVDIDRSELDCSSKEMTTIGEKEDILTTNAALDFAEAVTQAVSQVEEEDEEESTEKNRTEMQIYDFEKDIPAFENHKQPKQQQLTQDVCRKRSASLCAPQSASDNNINQTEADVMTTHAICSNKPVKVDCAPTDFGKLISLACKNIHSNAEDHFSNFGKIIAHKLRSMDATQAIFAEKIIADVLFQGQMKLLTSMNVNQFLNMDCSNIGNSEIYHSTRK